MYIKIMYFHVLSVSLNFIDHVLTHLTGDYMKSQNSQNKASTYILKYGVNKSPPPRQTDRQTD